MADLLVLPERVATLEFDDGALKGAEIVVSASMRTEVYASIEEWFAQLAHGKSQNERVVAARELQKILACHLRSWNLADADGPLPADLSGVQKLDWAHLAGIVTTWRGWMGFAPFPLPEASPTSSRARRPTKRNGASRSCTGSSSTAAGRSKRSTTRTSTASVASSA